MARSGTGESGFLWPGFAQTGLAAGGVSLSRSSGAAHPTAAALVCGINRPSSGLRAAAPLFRAKGYEMASNEFDPRFRCTAQSKQRKALGDADPRCRRRAAPGLSVCVMHGGSTKAAKAKGRQNLADAAMERTAVAVYAETAGDIPPITNPLQALSELAGEVVAWQAYLREELKRLPELATRDHWGKEDARAVVALYERALDRSGNILTKIGRLNIDERLARIHEAEGLLMFAAVEAALRKAGLPVPARDEVMQALAGEVRRLQARGQADPLPVLTVEASELV